MLSPLHFWLCFVGLGLMLVLLAWLGSRRRRLSPRQVKAARGEVACGRCGYDVRGLPSDICPECGGDLNEVGRLAPQFRRWQAVPPLLRGVAFGGVVLLLAAMLGGLALTDHVPYRQRQTGTEYLRLRTLILPDNSLLLLQSTVVRDEWHASGSQTRTSDSRLSAAPIVRQVVIEGIRGNPANGTSIGPAIARLEIDAISGRWSIVQGTQVLRAGTNPMTPEDVLFFLSLAVYPDNVRPEVTQIVERATGGVDADRVERDKARRLLSAAGALYCNTRDMGRVWLGMDAHGGASHWADQVPERWRSSLPRDDFLLSYQAGGTGELMYFGGTGDIDWQPSLAHVVPMGLFWLAVLIASVLFASRRRSIRTRPAVAHEGSSTLPGPDRQAFGAPATRE